MVSDEQIEWLGRVAYDTSLARMESIREQILAGNQHAAKVLLLEHSPVITLGRNARPENIVLSPQALQEEKIDVRQIRRGGDVTYHGPGQLMVYLVVKIECGIADFLHVVATALSDLAASYGADGAVWKNDPAGLWLGERKLAACGLHLRRRVCIHGFTFNLATPKAAWNTIVPCGIVGPPPISLADIIGPENTPTTEEFAERCRPILGRALRGLTMDTGKNK